MKRNEITELLWDNSIRIDAIIWLAANSSNLCEELEEFLEEQADEAKRLLGKTPPRSADDFEDYLTDLSRRGKNGYLVKAQTPTLSKEGWFSWGSTTWNWFYFETWDEETVAKNLAEWRETIRLRTQEANEPTLPTASEKLPQA